MRAKPFNPQQQLFLDPTSIDPKVKTGGERRTYKQKRRQYLIFLLKYGTLIAQRKDSNLSYRNPSHILFSPAASTVISGAKWLVRRAAARWPEFESWSGTPWRFLLTERRRLRYTCSVMCDCEQSCMDVRVCEHNKLKKDGIMPTNL